MNYQIGDKVRIKGIEWYDRNKDKDGFVSISESIPFNEEIYEIP